ncbi:MAG: sirohydrochlorin chelatase [Calothrix sp. SM1_7_51]|nr:sirohydrochlorin chelatase [Calothrix sp. SM1_7_51]
MSEAYLLVSHGSRDPRPGIAMQELARLLYNRLQDKFYADDSSPGLYENLVGVAALEFGPKTLHEQIIEFSQVASSFGCDCIKILPIFLLPGVHVMEDIPSEVALATEFLQEKTHQPKIKIDLLPHLGSHPQLLPLLAQLISLQNSQSLILLSHGSRRSGSNSPVEQIAAALSGVTAYWSVPPSLESRIRELAKSGHKQITIFPYFLFTGGITDAIASLVEKLKLEFLGELTEEVESKNSIINLQLAEPLGASKELAELIWDLSKNEPHKQKGEIFGERFI